MIDVSVVYASHCLAVCVESGLNPDWSLLFMFRMKKWSDSKNFFIPFSTFSHLKYVLFLFATNLQDTHMRGDNFKIRVNVSQQKIYLALERCNLQGIIKRDTKPDVWKEEEE